MSDRSRSPMTPSLALRRRARGVLSALLAQLILGLAINLIGMPSQTAGAAKVAASAFLILHVLVAIGLVVGAILTAVNARRTEAGFAGLGWIGLAVIIVTFAAGALTAATNSGWLSFLMGAGATASLVIYGILFTRTGQGQPQTAQ
ncbi:MAG TPA: hypothetical protein VL354_16645 [Spirochaetia bacterium]|nr:hypothetical protein [Spirochaetia bacterium]